MKKLLIVVVALLIAGCDEGAKKFNFENMSMYDILQKSYSHHAEIADQMRGRSCDESYHRILNYVDPRAEELSQLRKAVNRVTENARSSSESLGILYEHQQKMRSIYQTESQFFLACPSEKRKLGDKLKF